MNPWSAVKRPVAIRRWAVINPPLSVLPGDTVEVAVGEAVYIQDNFTKAYTITGVRRVEGVKGRIYVKGGVFITGDGEVVE